MPRAGERNGFRDNGKEAVGTAAPLKQSEWVPQLHVLKNAEANTKAYGLNQKTMQALDVLAKEIGDL